MVEVAGCCVLNRLSWIGKLGITSCMPITNAKLPAGISQLSLLVFLTRFWLSLELC